MNKGIWAGLVAIAFVAGSIMTGTMAYAASNAQGQPFQALQQQIDEIKEQIGIGGDNFTVDSFFDVFYQIDMSGDQCRTGDIPKLNEDLTDTDCSSDFAVDSFFDIFYRIETDTNRNTENIGEIQTELVALELRSLPPVCASGDVVKYNGLTGLWECAVDQTGAGVETDPVFGSSVAAGIAQSDIDRWDSSLTTEIDPEVGTLVSGQWCRSDGIKIDCDVAPVDQSQLQKRVNGVCAPGSSIRQVNVDGSVLCEPDDQGSGSIGRLQVVPRDGPTVSFRGPVADSFATCLDGEIVVGGGYRTTDVFTNVFREEIAFAAGPSGPAFGWLITAFSSSGTGTITAIANCGTIVP